MKEDKTEPTKVAQEPSDMTPEEYAEWERKKNENLKAMELPKKSQVRGLGGEFKAAGYKLKD
jgi:hypothetical protein